MDAGTERAPLPPRRKSGLPDLRINNAKPGQARDSSGKGRERSSPEGGKSARAAQVAPPPRPPPHAGEGEQAHKSESSYMPQFSAPIFPRFSDTEYRRRHDLVRAKMAERGLDAVVAAGDSTFRKGNLHNIYWLNNLFVPS